MSPTRKQTSSETGRHQPYCSHQLTQPARSIDAPAPATKSQPTPRETTRDLFLEVVRKMYPYYTPRHDFDVVALSNGHYKGPKEGIVKYLDTQLALLAGKSGGTAAALRSAEEMLSTKADGTGFKPRPGDPGVFIRPIPKTKYSIRLFPGSIAAGEYCLDFVLTATGQPVNSPFKFQLLFAPSRTAPVGTSGPIVQARPLECAFGIPQQQIPQGTEKFLLRDGQHCVLRRPGHRDVRFTVPMRRRPEPAQPLDADYLDLPEWA